VSALVSPAAGSRAPKQNTIDMETNTVTSALQLRDRVDKYIDTHGPALLGAVFILAIVKEVLKTNPRVLKDPAPVVGISALADSAINISVKPWTAVPDYNPARAEIYQTLLDQFRANKIEIPFPQREVRMLNSG